MRRWHVVDSTLFLGLPSSFRAQQYPLLRAHLRYLANKLTLNHRRKRFLDDRLARQLVPRKHTSCGQRQHYDKHKMTAYPSFSNWIVLVSTSTVADVRNRDECCRLRKTCHKSTSSCTIRGTRNVDHSSITLTDSIERISRNARLITRALLSQSLKWHTCVRIYSKSRILAMCT